MTKRRFNRKPPGLCSEPDADDGIDPRLVPKNAPGTVSNRKALQLCRQVERALSVALEGEILRDLAVQSVIPAPDSSRLLVVFIHHGPESISPGEVLTALHSAYAKLRGAVAAAIHRKKTPELAFHVVAVQARL
jgi:ribosome-binding factor A